MVLKKRATRPFAIECRLYGQVAENVGIYCVGPLSTRASIVD